MKTLQEISDRIEIEELLTDYCYVIDTHDYDALDDIFTPDAHIDFSATGGATGDLPSIKAFLVTALDNFAKHQHLPSGFKIVVDGDTATVRSMCHNPMPFPGDTGKAALLMLGLWYHDELVRTSDGWRITHRHQELSYMKNLP